MSAAKMRIDGCSEMPCACGMRVVLSRRRSRAIPTFKGHSPPRMWLTFSIRPDSWPMWIGFLKGSLNNESYGHRHVEADGPRSAGNDHSTEPGVHRTHRCFGRPPGQNL